MDMITTSASGIDPDISKANARLQANRVAKVRGVPLSRVLALVSKETDGRDLGFLGEPGVNVLLLNLDLDQAFGPPHAHMSTDTLSTRTPRPLFTRDIVIPALWASLKKLDPRVQIRNPVMFVVEIGAAITTGHLRGGPGPRHHRLAGLHRRRSRSGSG